VSKQTPPLDEVIVVRVKAETRLQLAELVIDRGQSLSDLVRAWIERGVAEVASENLDGG
jgi:hypothetical protein